MYFVHSLIKEISSRMLRGYNNVAHSLHYYKIIKKIHKYPRMDKSDTAIIIHLYYIDLWPHISQFLRTVDFSNFDIFVSIPTNSFSYGEKIRKDYPDARIIEVPNRGRDVLPFLMICKGIVDKGYIKILKIHSKKSTHRKDGQEWLDGMLNTLLPDNRKQLDSIIAKLDDPNTGIIGPHNQYISLPVNFDANSMHILKLIQEIFDKKTSQEISNKRTDYGFFAGTMFWARMDTISSVINHSFNIRDFEAENGQIDGTLPHALERVFTLVAELEGKNIFESGPNGVRELAYKTSNIPDWSDVYIGPK